MRATRAFGLAASILLVAACSTTPTSPPGEPAVIAVEVSLDPADQADAESITAAVRYVVERRGHGRVEGVPVSVRVLDDSQLGRPDSVLAAANLRSLVADPRVIAVVGPIQSSLAAVEIPIAAAAHLALVSPANTNPCLTRATGGCGDLPVRLRGPAPVSYFRVLATDDLAGQAAATYALTTLRTGPVAVASDGTTYGQDLADGFAAEARRLGVTPALRRDFDPRSKPARDSFLQDSATAGAKAVFFGGRQDGGACLVRAAMNSTLSPATPLLGGDSLLSPACIDEAGGAGIIFAVSSGPDPAKTAADAAAPTGPYAAPATDAAGVILAALSRAVKAGGGNRPSREEVRAQVARTRDYRGSWGTFSFDSRGDTTLRTFSIWAPSGSPPAWARIATVSL